MCKRLNIIAIIILIFLFSIYIIVSNNNIFTSGEVNEDIKRILKLEKRELIDFVTKENQIFLLLEEEKNNQKKIFLVAYKKINNNKNSYEKVYEDDFTKISPWLIGVTDVDGDEIDEIYTLVEKSTHFDERLANRLFIFNLIDGKLYKKWTGSKLGNNLIHCKFIDLVNIPGEELIVIDEKDENKKRILIYYWFDFGFQMLAESPYFDDIKSINHVDDGTIEVIIIEDGIEKKKLFTLKRGKIIEVLNK